MMKHFIPSAWPFTVSTKTGTATGPGIGARGVTVMITKSSFSDARVADTSKMIAARINNK